MSRFTTIVVVVAALALAACSRMGNGPGGVRSVMERKAAPNFSLKDADGRTVQLSDYRGKVVLLNFWATWCPPCKIEIPWFIEFEREHKGEGFAVIGVAMDDEGWEAVKPYVRDAGVNYRVLLGADSVAQLYGGVDSLPTTFVIDREGRVAAVHIGLVGKDTYEKDLREVLQNSPGAARFGGAVEPVRVARAR